MFGIYDTINPTQMIERKSFRKLKWVTFSESLTASSNGTAQISISDDAHFLCEYLGGEFTTLTDVSTDGNANGISIKLTDNGSSYPIFDNLTPVSIFLSPGRQRVSGVAGDPGNPLFNPIEFNYPFMAGTSIQVEWSNSLAYANRLTLVFYGQWVAKENPPPELFA